VGSELGRKLYGWAFKVHDKYFTPCHLAHHPHTLLEDAKSLHATKEKYQNTAIN
jgi:hypothetical protein